MNHNFKSRGTNHDCKKNIIVSHKETKYRHMGMKIATSNETQIYIESSKVVVTGEQITTILRTTQMVVTLTTKLNISI